MKKSIFLSLALLISFSFMLPAQTALDFDGVDDYVQTSYPGISGNSARTVKAWIKTTAISNPGSGGTKKVITDWGIQSSGKRFTFNMFMDNAIRIELGGGSLNGAIPVNDGIWHHVAVTYDPANLNNFSLYVDGVLDTAGNVNTTVNTSLSVDLRIGMQVNGAKIFEGEIDEVSVWDKALTQQEIIDFACIGSDPSQIDNLIAYYDFNEGTGSTLTDLAGGYNGTLINMDEEDWVVSDVCESGYNITFIVTEDDEVTPVVDAMIDLQGDIKYTGANGEAVFYYYEAGNYNYSVSKSGYYDQTGTAEVIDDEVTVNVILPLIVYYDITFIVTEDPGGAPVDSAIVNVDGILQYTNENGEATFQNYLPGLYAYVVTRDGYSLVTGMAEVIDEDLTIDVGLLITHIRKNDLQGILIYPNPARGKLNIDFEEDYTSQMTIIISDLSGRTVRNINMDCNNKQIDLTGIQKGIFILTIQRDDKTFTIPFVIQ